MVAVFALLVALVFEIIGELIGLPRGKGLPFPLRRLSSRSEAGSQGCAVCRAPRSGLALTAWLGSATAREGDYPPRFGSPASITMRSIIYASISHQD